MSTAQACKRLAEAVRRGDVTESQKIAAQLAKSKAHILVTEAKEQYYDMEPGVGHHHHYMHMDINPEGVAGGHMELDMSQETDTDGTHTGHASPQYSKHEFLQVLQSMGFTKSKENEQAWLISEGRMDVAVEWLDQDPAERKQVAGTGAVSPHGPADPDEASKELIEALRRQDSIERKDRMHEEEQSSQLIQELQRKEQEEKERRKKYNQEMLAQSEAVLAKLKQTPEKGVEPNLAEFDCLICFDTIEVGVGVALRSCGHQLCMDCISQNVEFAINNAEYPVSCPDQKCRKPLAQADIRAIVGEEKFLKLEERMMGNFEAENRDAFHCLSKDCRGWCVFEEDALDFRCPICKCFNCIPCKAQHPKKNCKQYQEDLKLAAQNDKDAQATQAGIEAMIAKREMMRCPGCQILVSKLSGCDWMKCRMCKTEICWATMGPRWGKGGNGDKSGGCGCQYPAKKCHPNCGNCH